MPSLPPRLLVGLYVAAAVIVVGALLTSDQPASTATAPTEAAPSAPEQQTYNLFPAAEDRATTTPTVVAVASKQPAAVAAALQPEPTPPYTLPTRRHERGSRGPRQGSGHSREGNPTASGYHFS